MGKQRFIQVGCGGFGAFWVTQFMPRLIDELEIAEAVAVVDINPDTLPQAQRCYHLPPEKCYDSLESACNENSADFLIVVVPSAQHAKMVDIGLTHDLHILSEKPIADTMAACCRVYKKVKAADKKMAVTMSHRFDQDKQTLEREIKSGAYGELNYLVGRNTWNCRKRGQWSQSRYDVPDTLLVEGTVHHFDICRSLTDANAKTVYALTWNPPWGEFAGDSTGLITIEMENGVKVSYEGAKANATELNGWTQDYFRAECRDATLELDKREIRIFTDLDGERKITEKRLLQQPAWMNLWLAELFVNWLNGGNPPPNTLDDNIQCAALQFAAIESAHTGAVVDVQEFLRKSMDG